MSKSKAECVNIYQQHKKQANTANSNGCKPGKTNKKSNCTKWGKNTSTTLETTQEAKKNTR